MWQRISNFFTKNRHFIPLMSTIVLALAAYGIGAYFFVGMRNPQVFFNLFRNSSFLLISGIGMTFVILTGGIDLSVSGVVALTTVASAVLLREGWNPWAVILLMLAMGMTLGAIMGSFIVYLKVQPFIATLAGMWFARGMCFFISDNVVAIDDRIFQILGKTKILIPGLTELAAIQGDPAPYISIPVVVAFSLLILAIYVAHYTRLGRTIYAIGGNEGRNEQSARLMGLPVDRTKMLVYTFNGFCSALAGLSFSLFVSSGHGLYASGFELDVIASVVMGGTMLTGGSGYVFGTLFGVLVLAVTQTLIQFIGSLSSWWTRIVIGVLTLTFIGVQTILANRKTGRQSTQTAQELLAVRRKRQRLMVGSGAIVVLALLAIVFVPKNETTATGNSSQTTQCVVKPFREEEAANLIKDGAVIVYNRTAGPLCVDELFAIYPDGRVIGNDGVNEVEKQVDPAEVEQVLAKISGEYKWFTSAIYGRYLTPCRQCFAHYITISYEGQEKTVSQVDGTASMPAGYTLTLAVIRPMLPEINPAP
jgi:ribose/xylose/arabinose/galactoside ABC-type transport system permease subunit